MEHEARIAQKKLEEEKAKIRQQKTIQIAKQNANSAALKVYCKAMNLQFHKTEEEFNSNMSLLTIYHLELHENFLYYAQPFEAFYHREENELIPLQGFFNFLKVLKIAH